jgi:hypothetical protein
MLVGTQSIESMISLGARRTSPASAHNDTPRQWTRMLHHLEQSGEVFN